MATTRLDRSGPRSVPVRARARTVRSSRWSRTIVPLVGAAALAFLVVTPLVRVQVLAAEDGGAAYRRALDVPSFGETLGTTAALALGSAAIALVAGTALAWTSTRLPRRLGALATLPLLPIVIPPVASITGWGFMLSPTVGYLNQALRATPVFGGDTGPIDIYQVRWIVILTGFLLTPFVYAFVRAGIRNLNHELIEAARSSGATPRQALFQIVLPMLRPSLIYAGVVVLLLGLGQFTPVLLLGTRGGVRVMSTEVYRHVNENPDYAMAAALASPLLVVGIVLIVAQRALLGDQARFVSDVGKGTVRSGRTTRWAVLPIVGFSAVSVLVPLTGVALVAVSPYWSGSIDTSAMSLEHFRTLFDDSRTLPAIRTSLVASFAGVAGAVPVGFWASSVLHRRRAHPLALRVIDLVVSLPLGVPAVVFGAGFLFTYRGEPFDLYGSRWVLVLLYVALMLPYTTRMQLAARIALGSTYEEASRVSGAGPIRTLLDVTVPLLRSAVSGSAALMFVLLSHEFTASLFVRTTRTQVMGTVLYDVWSSSGYGQVAAMALVMSAVTAIGVGVTVWLGGRNAFDNL